MFERERGQPYTVLIYGFTLNDTLIVDLVNSEPNDYKAGGLQLEMTFYQSGIARVTITCPGEDPRFAISDTGLPVEWQQLRQVTDLKEKATISETNVTITLADEDRVSVSKYVVQLNPFRILLYTNGELATIVNDDDSLAYAAPSKN